MRERDYLDATLRRPVIAALAFAALAQGAVNAWIVTRVVAQAGGLGRPFEDSTLLMLCGAFGAGFLAAVILLGELRRPDRGR